MPNQSTRCILSIMETYDVIIIGAGPAGLTAAIYTSRAKLHTLVIEKPTPGSQMLLADMIENYPGFPNGISGPDLATLMKTQAERFGAIFTTETVCEILQEDNNNNNKTRIVRTDKTEYTTTALILATGGGTRPLTYKGETEFISRGVSYCATCDGAFFEGAEVAVVGDGDAAIEEATFLTRFASMVYIIHKKDSINITDPKIKTIPNTEIEEIIGTETVERLTLRNLKTNTLSDLPVKGVFMFVKTENTAFLNALVSTDEKGYITADETTKTNAPGVFACGDVRTKELRQVSTAVSDGSVAAKAAIKYIETVSR